MNHEEFNKGCFEEAKKLYKTANADQRYVLETLFPELVESKNENNDERIRKALLEYFGEQCDMSDWNGIYGYEVVAWLEKQGEQKIDDDDKAILENWEGIVKDNKEKWQLSDWFVEATLLLVQKIKRIGLSKPIVDNNKTMLNACINTLRNIGHSHLAAWLEKQGGKKKPYGQRKECFDCQFNYAGECKGYCTMKRDEQKSDDKVEPKFKVGDWVVHDMSDGKKVIRQIINMTNKSYILDGEDFNTFYFNDLENDYHLWTIQDAKDGDVLAFDNDTIVIFKDLYNATTFHSYCHIEDGLFEVSKDDMPDWWKGEGFQPATKEQRDILKKTMTNAGYEWDAEKKELKKIEQKSDSFCKKHCKGFQETGKCFADGDCKDKREAESIDKIEDEPENYKQQVMSEMTDLVKDYVRQKPSWSEEDERMFRHLHNVIFVVRDCDCDSKEKLKLFDWIETLKGRYKSKQEREWSKEDEKCIRLSTDIIDSALRAGFCVQLDRDRCVDWFKSLKQRIGG